jgi:hypothetical protein
MSEEKLLTAEQVGTRWGVHKATVLRLYHDGILPGVIISRGRERMTVRFRPEAVLAWERKREKAVVVEAADSASKHAR